MNSSTHHTSAYELINSSLSFDTCIEGDLHQRQEVLVYYYLNGMLRQVDEIKEYRYVIMITMLLLLMMMRIMIRMMIFMMIVMVIMMIDSDYDDNYDDTG